MIHPILESLEKMQDRWWDRKLEQLQELARVIGEEYSQAKLNQMREQGKQSAYSDLKFDTGQDFGWDIPAWENWLRLHTNAFKY